MLFKWLKRGAAPAPKPRRSPAGKNGPPSLSEPPDSGALPEVVGEGNTQADWSAWEDSMTALDSQLPQPQPGDRFHVRDTYPSRLDEQDPFSSIGQRKR
jgi:hypothetical protein